MTLREELRAIRANYKRDMAKIASDLKSDLAAIKAKP